MQGRNGMLYMVSKQRLPVSQNLLTKEPFCQPEIIMIITLFQEDNIFGTNASLTNIWSTVTIFMMRENVTYLQYVQSRRGLPIPSMLRAGYPTLLAWGTRGGAICPGSRPAGTTRSPR